MSHRTLSETFSLNFNENQTLVQVMTGSPRMSHHVPPHIIVSGSHWAFVVVVTVVVDFDDDGGKSVG